MARYIDADAVLDKLPADLPYKASVKRVLMQTPAADVAPKREVEALQEALSKAEADVKNYMKVAEYQQSLSVKRYHEIKRLKEDVERLQDINERDVENIRLAKAEVAREIFEEIENNLKELKDDYRLLDDMRQTCAVRYAMTRVAELKKKYTEG